MHLRFLQGTGVWTETGSNLRSLPGWEKMLPPGLQELPLQTHSPLTMTPRREDEYEYTQFAGGQNEAQRSINLLKV